MQPGKAKGSASETLVQRDVRGDCLTLIETNQNDESLRACLATSSSLPCGCRLRSQARLRSNCKYDQSECTRLTKLTERCRVTAMRKVVRKGQRDMLRRRGNVLRSASVGADMPSLRGAQGHFSAGPRFFPDGLLSENRGKMSICLPRDLCIPLYGAPPFFRVTPHNSRGARCRFDMGRAAVVECGRGPMGKDV